MTTASVRPFGFIKKLNFILTTQEKKQCLLMIASAIFVSVLEICTVSLIMLLVSGFSKPEQVLGYLNKYSFFHVATSNQALLYLVIIVGIGYLIKNAFMVFEAFHYHYTIQKMNHRVKSSLLKRYARMDYGFYLTQSSVSGLNVLNNDVENFFSFGVVGLAGVISESFIIICLVGALVFLNPILALLFFVGGGTVSFLLLMVLLPRFYRWGNLQKEALFVSQKHLLQFFHAFKEVLLSGKQTIFVAQYDEQMEKLAKVKAAYFTANSLPRIVLEVLFIGLFVIALGYFYLQHQQFSQMLSILAGYLYVGLRIMPGLNRMIIQLNTVKLTLPNIEQIYTEYTKIPVVNNYLDVPNFTFTQKICLKDVYFNYPQTKKKALFNINLQINKGECLGIVGETGSGKSTLIDVVLGLLKPSQGEVLVDEKYPVNCYQWHQLIGYVPQSVYLLDDSIEANILFGEDSSNLDLNKLNYALKAAQLNKFVSQLPLGIKTKVGERGIQLSGGERQRIAIARALYRDPQILILDEATSALDNDTETKLMQTIDAVSKDRTVIIIAHRLTTLKNCDRILMIEQGAIKEIIDYNQLQSHAQKVGVAAYIEQ